MRRMYCTLCSTIVSCKDYHLRSMPPNPTTVYKYIGQMGISGQVSEAGVSIFLLYTSIIGRYGDKWAGE